MKCPKCQIFLPDDALFCFKCGEKLSPKPDHIDLKTGVEGERKRLTALFSDLSGYTAMTVKLDPEEIMEITGRIFDGVKAVVKKYEGFIERFAGDGVLVLLGIPKAHEDDPIRAIHAAREIHRLVDSMSPHYEDKIGRPLSMHSGINTGLVVTADFNPEKGTHDSAGDAINVAARLSDIAGAGEILVGHETYKASRNHFAFLQLNPASIKGKNDPILIYKLKSVSPFAAPFRRGRQVSSSMVGRKRELERLALQVLKAVNGEGSIVNIMGEAGIGKSRLVAELKKMERVESIEFLEGSAISIGRNLSFYPIIELLKKWARIREDDGEAMAYGRLEAAVRSLYPEKAGEILPFVAILMGMKLSGTYAERVRGIEGEALEKLILKNIRLLLTRATEISPLVVVIDDLHWADNSTIELIQSLFHLVETQRIVYINVFRPNHPETGDQIVAYVKENLPDYYAELMIEPLNEEMSQALISNMLRIKDLKHIVLGQIISRAGGNPFFIEEVVRSFIDESVVVLKNGRFEVTEKIDQMVIPDKIIDVLMARIDRLDEETRRLVKVASVIGRNFFYKIIKEVAVQVEDIDSKLASLKELQLIRERKRMDEIEFLFKHALAQEVAYESILQKKRKKLHLRVARSIEKTFKKRLHEFYGLLAYHYSNGEDLDKAEDYLIKAGEEALRSSASSEALKYYQQGLKLYLLKHGDDAEPEKLAKFEKNIALALYNRGNLESALEYFDKVLNRWGAGTSNNTLLIPFKVLFDLFGVVSKLYFFKKRGKRIPDTLENEIFNLRYKKAVSLVHLDPEKCFIEFMSTLNRLRKYDTTKIENGIGMWMSGSGLFSWTGISFKLSKRMLDYNKPIINKEDSKEVLYFDLFELLHHSFVGKWMNVKEYDQNLVESNLKIGEFWHTATYLLFHGYINIGQGEFEKVETILSKLNEISKDYGNENGTEFWYTLKIQLLITFGELHSALKLVDEGILFLAKTGRESVIIYYLGLKATIQVLSNDFGQAEETMKRIKERKSGKIRLLPIYISSYRLARFLFNLHCLEQSILKHDKSNILKYRKKAYQSGNYALKNSKKFAFSRTELYRLMGSYYWLIDKNKKAFGLWIRGIKEAEQLGARVEHARILMEIGRHLHDVKSKNTKYHGFSADDYLQKARLFFEEKGLDQDLTQAGSNRGQLSRGTLMSGLNKNKLYRLPWSLYDNPIGWVEITDKCNMDCLGCYRNYLETNEGHKPIEDIKEEVLFMQKVRNASEITLAGGEPLLHPEIVDIVKFIASQSLGVKIFSNGKGLTKELLQQLVSSGLSQITLHIDSFQTRKDEWDNKSEIELNALRQYYLDISKNLRNLDLSFACMVTRQNLKDIPDLIRWSLKKRGRVGGIAFFALRQYETVFNDDKPALVSVNTQDNVHSEDIYYEIRKGFPQYDVAAYFGGTSNPQSFKWLFSVSLCGPDAMVGSVSPISMELHQVLKHLKHGRYVGDDKNEGIIERFFTKLLFLIFDRKVRGILLSLLKKPLLLLNTLYLFRIIIVQAHDISAYGDMDMCDGCPDMTLFKGRLVNSCRLDEYRKYGQIISDLRDEIKI